MLEHRGDPSYPFLKDLDTEQLEQLLRQEFDSADAAEPDTDYIMAIMEVIREREMEPSGEARPDVDAAWRDFQENYQGQFAAYEPVDCGSASNHPNQILSSKKPRRKTLPLRIAVILAAAVALLSVASSAFGMDFFQAFVRWGSETFGFETKETRMQGGSEETPAAEEEDPFLKLKLAVSRETDILAVPTWAPEGTQEEGNISTIEHTDGLRIAGTYATDQGEFTIRVRIYNDIPENYSTKYQMNEDQTQTAYEAGGVMHYLTENYDKCEATWLNENVEGHIQGVLSMEDLKTMVDSIYEE